MQKNNNPTIAVIIPTYNRADTLEKCISSVLNQTTKVDEIIVIDDCSTDDTQSTLKSMDYITILKTEKRSGAQKARNLGIKASNSEWIAFLDSDDEWLPDKIEKQISVLESVDFNPKTVVHGDCILNNNNSGKRKNWNLNEIEGDVYKQLLTSSGTFFPAILTSKTALKDIGYLTEDIYAYQEWDTAIRLAKHCKFYHIRDPLFIYSISEDSISNSFSNEVEGYLQIVTKYESEIQDVCGERILDNHFVKCSQMAMNFGNFSYGRKLLGKVGEKNLKNFCLVLLSYMHIKPKYLYKIKTYLS